MVLDVIEAGEMPTLARLSRPVEALHQLCGDPTLTCSVPLNDGRQVTALQLQRFYLAACQQFLARRPDAPDEAHEVVATWEEVLEALEQLQLGGDIPPSLIGTVDWVTKKQLIDEAGHDTSWEGARKSTSVITNCHRWGISRCSRPLDWPPRSSAHKNWTARCGHPLPTRPPRCAVTISASSLRMGQSCP